MSANASFAIIDGKPLHPDTGQALDGLVAPDRSNNIENRKSSNLERESNTNSKLTTSKQQQQPTPTVTRPVIDGLGGPRRKLPTALQPTKQPTKPQPATTMPAPAQPKTQTQSKAQTDREKALNDQLVQSRTLANRRAERASRFQQHHAISKFGSTKHDQRQAEPATPEITPNYKPSEEIAVSAIAQQVYRPRGAIGQHLASHDRDQQPATASADYQLEKKSFFAWLNPSAKVMKVATVTMSVVVLSAYVAYLNAPNISVRIAASRAGINAQLPGYTPSSFALNGPVEYETGKVVLNFRSNSDNRTFTITEEESRWNSETLRENAVANTTDDYETVRRAGLTIYIWDGSNAAWVNQGIRYTLSGESQLSQEQIAQIAVSL